MKIVLSFVMAALMAAIDVQAQIPDKVKDIMQKCSEKMENPAGLEIDMNIHLGMVVLSMNGSAKMYSKGDLSRSKVVFKVLGREMREESGFDGVNEWEFKSADNKNAKDTLIIKKADKKSKGDYDMDFDMEDDYKKAELKEKGKFYIITFSQPKDKDTPKKATMKISKETYYFQEMEAKMGIASMKMTAEKFKIGVSDDVFRFSPDDFPGAVIVRK